ncbi:MAG: Gfo/Idh/MocA family oxidoreductase [Candidatus Bathyarchaeia archaeon]
MERLGIGFVGTGFVNTFHANAFRAVRDAEITAVYSRTEEKGKSFASLCRELRVGDPKTYTDLAKMVEDPEVDAVWIGNPNFLRVQTVRTIVEEVTQGKAELKGICCEKPLARNVKEAQELVNLVEKARLLHGYLENNVFMPPIVRGKDILWRRGAAIAGRPYLARAAEEHSGPHSPWFWIGRNTGGGVLMDMACHSLEASRFLLTSPSEDKGSIVPKAVSAEIATLKWAVPRYMEALRSRWKGEVDYAKEPAEDYARVNIVYESKEGEVLIAETFNSWSFMGPGMRLMFELIGPEYFMYINDQQPYLHVFFSREVKGPAGEDFMEKQTAEQGLMPVLDDESFVYGYQWEDRHMVESFLKGEMPRENWHDGLFIVKLMMTAYMAAESGKKLRFPPPGLEDYIPGVQKGTYSPRSILEGSI